MMNKKIEKALRSIAESGPCPEEGELEALTLRGDGRLTRSPEPGSSLLTSTAALGTIRVALELDCEISEELSKDLRAAFKIQPAMSLLRDGMTAIMAPPHGSRGLKLAVETGLITHVLGVGVWETARGIEREEFMTLVENFEMARPEADYRWALVFRRFNRKRMENAIIALRFGNDRETRFIKTLRCVDKLYFLNTKLEFKRFVKRCGYDDYYFIDRVARQERKIFDRNDLKIENRFYILEEIKARGEPMGVDDLVIDEGDLRELGISASESECERILYSLADIVIVKPEKNKREILLKEAERIKKNPLMILINKVNWIK